MNARREDDPLVDSPIDLDGKPLDIVGIGVSVSDHIMLIDSMPQAGEVVQARSRINSIGGGVTVAIATAAKSGSRVAMIDALGDDSASDGIVRSLEKTGVDVSAIHREPGGTCSAASIWTESNTAERTIVFCPGTACDALRWSEAIAQKVRSAKVLHLNGRHLEVCQRAIKWAKRSGTKISFDGGAYRYRDEILPILSASDIVIVARQFAEQWLLQAVNDSRADVEARAVRDSADHNRTIEELADSLMTRLRCEIVGVTDGARGSYLVHSSGERVFQSAIDPQKAIDTTGCGDSYHGAFLSSYANRGSLSAAAKTAAEVASKTSQQLGGFASR